MTTGRPEIVIAIVDSGVEDAHTRSSQVPSSRATTSSTTTPMRHPSTSTEPASRVPQRRGRTTASAASARAFAAASCRSRSSGRGYRPEHPHRGGNRLRSRPRSGRGEREPHRAELAAGPGARDHARTCSRCTRRCCGRERVDGRSPVSCCDSGRSLAWAHGSSRDSDARRERTSGSRSAGSAASARVKTSRRGARTACG